MERALFILFLPLGVINSVKNLYKNKKRPKKNEKIRSPEKSCLKTWGCESPKGQRADARWVMACNHKTQSFIKNGGQQNCLDEGLQTSWLLLTDYCTFAPRFLLMILVQNFDLINNHRKTWVWKSTEIKFYWPLKFCNSIINLTINSSSSSLL